MFLPKCVATYASPAKEEGEPGEGDSQYFRNIQWTADGTTLLASMADNSIRTFIVPPNILDKTDEPHLLSAYYTIQARESVNCAVGYPFFNLEDPSTALVLSSMRDHPIRLQSALTGYLGASYPLVNPMTEVFISPHSLLFNGQGDRFIAGSESLISIFDVSRPGQEPLSSIPTGPKRRKNIDYSGAVNMRGIVSALAIDSSTGVLAAGTYSRHVGLYDSSGQGDCIGVFSVEGTDADSHIGGGGITQVSWSPCGRYLFITERKSDGILLYDIRKTGQLLAWLEGRAAHTNQRLGVDVVGADGGAGQEVWAGGVDGLLRMWKNPYTRQGSVPPTFEYKGHDDVISSAVVHHGGGVLATSSGQRHFTDGIGEHWIGEAEFDNSLKIWTL